jgi:anion-transporting  ArsA/GET3 family ATPase
MSSPLVRSLEKCEVVVCCGSGGVGKTTTSAVLAMVLAAKEDARVLVLTIDPAKRLATALGIDSLGGDPVRISNARLRQAGVDVRGEMWAAMLDPKSTWDAVVERYAPDRDTARAIKANRFYKTISDSFAGSQEYIAMEALYELHRGGEYDCVVVDTPPSRNALDFLDAPSRVSDFVGKRFIGWLGGGTRLGFRAFDFAATPFIHIAERVLGTGGLDELREFATLIRSLYAGVQRRGHDVYRLMRSSKTGFVVVTTLDAGSFDEAKFFTKKLRGYSMPLRGVVVNRVLPQWLADREAAKAATTLVEDGDLSKWLASNCDIKANDQTLVRLGETFLTYQHLATRDAVQLSALAQLGPAPVATVPLFNQGVSDLEGLAKIAQSL